MDDKKSSHINVMVDESSREAKNKAESLMLKQTIGLNLAKIEIHKSVKNSFAY